MIPALPAAILAGAEEAGRCYTPPDMTYLDQLLALLRWKRMILLNTLGVAVASVIVALLLPKWYRATASVFPPEEEGGILSNLSGPMSAATFGAGRSALPVLASPSDLLAAVVDSRTVREEIVRQFDLAPVYKVKTVDEALEVMRGRVTIKVGGEGVVKVRVLDRDPERAAAMANAFVAELDRVNREKRNSSARQARLFLERRLEQNRRDLAAAEDSLRWLQERTGALLPEEQLRTLIGAAAEVQVQLLLREVDLAVLRAQVGPGHPDLLAAEGETRALRARLDELEASPPELPGVPGAGRPLRLPLTAYPGLAVEYLRAARAVKVEETIFEFLTQQYEQYRLQESRDTPTVQVLDRAVPPTRRHRPVRWLICTSATLVAFAASVALAAALEALSRLRRDDAPRFDRLRRVAGELGLGAALDRVR